MEERHILGGSAVSQFLSHRSSASCSTESHIARQALFSCAMLSSVIEYMSGELVSRKQRRVLLADV